MELVSVIIPYFRKKKFIKSSVFSALKQTHRKLEIIIVYDDSDKSDLSYLKKTFKPYKNVKFLINQKNLGAGLSRNNGINRAKGKYICFLDADDLWKKNKLKLQIKFMKKYAYKISHTSYEIIDKNLNHKSFRIAKNFNNLNDIIKSCDIGLSTVVLEKKLFSNYIKFPKLKTKEDFVLWIKLLKNKNKIGGLDVKLTTWRKTDNSLSSSTVQKLFDGYKVYKIYMKFNFIKSIYYLFFLSINFLKKNV